MTTLSIAVLAISLATAGAASPGSSLATPRALGGGSALTSGGHVWTSFAGTGQAALTLGDRGGQVIELSSTYGLRLFSSFDSNPPVPIWQAALPNNLYWGEASSEDDVYLFGDNRILGPTTSQGSLRMFTSSSPTPVWSFDYPPQLLSFPAFGVSRNGEVIVSAFTDDLTGIVTVRVHDRASGVPLQTTNLSGPVWPGLVHLSPDGTFAALGGPVDSGASGVFDIAAQALVFTTQGAIPSRQALSNDGRVFVVRQLVPNVGWHFKLFARLAGTYQQIVDVQTSLSEYPYGMAVSDDGSTVVAGWYGEGPPSRSTIRAYDVASATMTMERIQIAQGGLYNVPSDVAISADGSRFVVGLWGDGAGTVPELAVYTPESSQPLVEHPLGGSVVAVEMSPDGKRYAASRAPGHVSAGYAYTQVELYEFGGEDLVVRGRPSVGATVRVELYGTAGASAVLLMSRALLPIPVIVPGVGTLYLELGFLPSAGVGTIPDTGVLVHSFDIPNDPALVGDTIYLQGFTTGPRTLTHDWVQLTILP